MSESDYRVMLVEDEIPIREGIRDVIEWESLGFTFLAEAKNGKEALDLFEKLAPDVVITDIHMPKLDGLSLTSAIRERTDETKIIILTGFDDFEYARTALKLKATDYLLKPVSPQELTKLLIQVKHDLDERGKASQGAENKNSPDALGLARRLAIIKMISGIEDPDLVSSLKRNDDQIDKALWFNSVIYDFDHTHRSINPDMYRAPFRTLNPNHVWSEIMPDRSGSLIELVFSSRIPYAEVDLESLTTQKRKLIADDTGLSISAGIGCEISDVAGIRRSYDSAIGGISHRYIHGGNENYHMQSVKESNTKRRSDTSLRFQKSVASGSVEEWPEYFSQIIDELKESDAPEEDSLETVTLAVSTMVNALKSNNANLNSDNIEDTLIIQKARSYKTIDDLHRWLREFLSEISTKMKDRRLETYFATAEKAKRYINDNFMHSSLALEDLYERLGVSQSTLSRIFNTYLDTNFSSYLRDVRIRAAKKLLRETDLRNKEIAFQIGFNSPHYFSHVFTKRVGYSPTEYRRKT
ncbi:MAG: response regulator [Spirochaetaceae bacterium]|nr:response regulator [Spirochaetaceae bacterium]